MKDLELLNDDENLPHLTELEKRLQDRLIAARQEIERLKSGGSGDVDTLEELGITDEFREEAP